MRFLVQDFNAELANSLVNERVDRAKAFAAAYENKAAAKVEGYVQGQGINLAKFLLFTWLDAFNSGLHAANITTDDRADFFEDTVLKKLDPNHNEETFYPDLRAWQGDQLA